MGFKCPSAIKKASRPRIYLILLYSIDMQILFKLQIDRPIDLTAWPHKKVNICYVRVRETHSGGLGKPTKNNA